ncbi:KdsC family phosphatase [Gillisia sp. CAL575]|uniref:KdsC family phosphatase n=1 Tax=Gillisia sp. CAL575 TaxID=985255 RepID=UPI0003A398DC|nr:HAD hydrolase family protein [Gillisia sp. CAL575]
MEKNIKLLVSDIDGVWTDGSFYYDFNGDSFRKFNTKDGFGVALAKLVDLPILILSGEDNEMVRFRLTKLKIEDYKLGVTNKLQVLIDHCAKLNIYLSEVAYLGDDMNDYNIINKVGLFACPSDAYMRVKDKADIILETAGGQGAFREFVENILQDKGVLDWAYDLYLNN